MNRDILLEIGSVLSRNEICWAVGGSTLLVKHGLTNRCNDLDLIIDLKDAQTVASLFLEKGKQVSSEYKAPFKTTYFQTFILSDTLIDVMGDFAISHEKGTYHLPFDSHAITYRERVSDVSIPYTSLEDWYVLYQLIPKKGEKADLIESYWKEYGIGFPDLLERALQQPLPEIVKMRIDKTLSLMR